VILAQTFHPRVISKRAQKGGRLLIKGGYMPPMPPIHNPPEVLNGAGIRDSAQLNAHERRKPKLPSNITARYHHDNNTPTTTLFNDSL